MVSNNKIGFLSFESLFPLLFLLSLLEEKIYIFEFMTILTLGDIINILKVDISWDEISDWGKLNTSLVLDGKINI